MLAKRRKKPTKLRVFEAFAGIGAQHKAIGLLKGTKVGFKVVGTSEWDAGAVIAYASIHNEAKLMSFKKEAEAKSDAEIDAYLSQFRFSLNSKTPGKVTKKDRAYKNLLWASNRANNNYPDIRGLGHKAMGSLKVDVLTYSFPCQGLSIANMGRGNGIAQDKESTSNLLWEIKRILDELKEHRKALPRFLVMENVTALLNPKHKPHYESWLAHLSGLGYQTSYAEVNAGDHGSLQQRKRLFAVSWQKEASRPYGQDHLANRLKAFQKTMQESEKEEMYNAIFANPDQTQQEESEATPRNTESRRTMANKNPRLDISVRLSDQRSKDRWKLRTLTTKQDRNPNVGMLTTKRKDKRKDRLRCRFITAREAYLMMGFANEDFARVYEHQKSGVLNNEQLYRQAGNSIVVPVMQQIFQVIAEMAEGE